MQISTSAPVAVRSCRHLGTCRSQLLRAFELVILLELGESLLRLTFIVVAQVARDAHAQQVHDHLNCEEGTGAARERQVSYWQASERVCCAAAGFPAYWWRRRALDRLLSSVARGEALRRRRTRW